MVTFKARCADDPDEELTPIEATSPQEAAENYVMQREWRACEFPVAAGRESMRVEVKTDGPLWHDRSVYKVEYDPKPHYIATEERDAT